MKILRLFFVLLLLANLGLAAYWFLNLQEPEVQTGVPAGQVHPELIKQLPARATENGLSAQHAESTDQSEPATQSQPGLQSAALVQTSPVICRAYTGVDAGVAALLMSQANSLGDVVVVREARNQDNGTTRFWVNIPPRGGKPGAEQRLAVLRSKGLDDLLIVNESGDEQYAISLGLYSTERLAQLRLDMLKEKGVENARVTRRDPPINIRVEIEGPTDVIDELEKEAGSGLVRAGHGKCRAG